MRNTYRIDGEVTYIDIPGCKEPLIIDTEDLDLVLSDGRDLWVLARVQGVPRYVGFRDKSGKKASLYLHRFIMGVHNRKGVQARFVSGNWLDCRKSNIYTLGNEAHMSNRVEIEGDITKIYIESMDKPVIIDTEDLPKIQAHNRTMFAHFCHGKYYPIFKITYKKHIRINRLIMGVTDNTIGVKFIDGDSFNCRKSNLVQRRKGSW